MYAEKERNRSDNGPFVGSELERIFLIDGTVRKSSHIVAKSTVNQGRLGIAFEKSAGRLMISRIVEGSPAERCKLLTIGDEVLEIRDVDDEVLDVHEFTGTKAAQYFRGLEHQPIRFSIRSGTTCKEIAIELTRVRNFVEQ